MLEFGPVDVVVLAVGEPRFEGAPFAELQRQAAAANVPQPDPLPVVYVAPPPQAMPPAPAAQDDTIAQLERLGALYSQGLLTEEEFAAQKAKLLGL